MRDAEGAVVRAAPAKINLYLHVVGRREDGLHLLDSVFLFAGLEDRIFVELDCDFSLTVTGPWGDAIMDLKSERNLAIEAARKLAEAAGLQAGARLTLQKNIPVAAGLGGGSADAAAALQACAELWEIDKASLDLGMLALELGADVPACLAACPMRVGGIGEELRPLSGRPDWGVLLVNPRTNLSTQEVFAAFRDSGRGFSEKLSSMAGWTDPAWLAQYSGNDLEDAAMSIAPVIGDVLAALRGLPDVRLVRMSGSGATCFGIFDGRDDACRAARNIQDRYPGWWVWAGDFVSRS